MSVPEIDRKLALNSLPVSEDVRAFLELLACPDGMKDLFQKPYYFYSQGYPHNPGEWKEFFHRNLLPLWEHRECVFAVDVSLHPPEYLSFYLESPAEYESYGTSIYRLLFRMLELHVWEYGGGRQAVIEAQEFANALGFPKYSELATIFDDSTCSQARIDQYLRQLV